MQNRKCWRLTSEAPIIKCSLEDCWAYSCFLFNVLSARQKLKVTQRCVSQANQKRLKLMLDDYYLAPLPSAGSAHPRSGSMCQLVETVTEVQNKTSRTAYRDPDFNV